MGCEHCHCNHNDEEKGNKIFFIEIISTVLFFIGGFLCKPLFIISYIIVGTSIIIDSLKSIFHCELFDENFLMSIATIGAIYLGEYPEAVMVMLLYRIGEYLQDKAVKKSEASIEALINIRPEYAEFNGEKVSPEIIKVGDVITVKAGERIPLDGIAEGGAAMVDMSALTGEAVPVQINQGDSVLSGGINLNGILKIRVTKEYKESTVNRILELIEGASSKKANAENFITKFAKIYTPIVILLACFVAFILPVITNTSNEVWFSRGLIFLVISCPCALVISIPLSFFAGIGRASSNGILIKGGNYLEQISKTGTVVFDKTGTLTEGFFFIQEICSDNPDIIKYAAIAESISSHPIACAIKKAYNGEIPELSETEEFSGSGVQALYEGKVIKVGTAKFIGVNEGVNEGANQGVNEGVNQGVNEGVNQVNAAGTVVYISIDDIPQGYIVLSDKIKEDTKTTIETLHKMNIKTAIFTGDDEKRAKKIQQESGIQEIYSKLLPADKVLMMEKLMLKSGTNKSVIFVGDGINDAPVLKRSDVGFAMGALGSDAAIEAADAVIMDDKPSKIIKAIKISKITMRIVRQNIILAIGVKILFLCLGAAGIMTMWCAVFADVGLTMIAILNSLRNRGQIDI